MKSGADFLPAGIKVLHTLRLSGALCLWNTWMGWLSLHFSVLVFFQLEGRQPEKLYIQVVYCVEIPFFWWMWVECSLDWINKLIQNSFTEYFPKHFFSIRKLKHALRPIFNLKNPSAYPQCCSIPTSRQEFQAAAFEVNASFYPCFYSLRFGTWSKTLQMTETISTDVRKSGWWRLHRQDLEFLLL